MNKFTIAIAVAATVAAYFMYKPAVDWDAEVINARYAFNQTAQGHMMLTMPGGEANFVQGVNYRLDRGETCKQIVPPVKSSAYRTPVDESLRQYVRALCGRETAKRGL